jgi:hypothetical protein
MPLTGHGAIEETTMRAKIAYIIMLAFLFSHEVDAALRHEWRVLPLTSFLPDDIGRQVFIWAHVPLFAAILLFNDRTGLRFGLAIFSLVHVGLHWGFRNHPAYEFNNLSSWLIIGGAGLFGGLYLALVRRRPSGGQIGPQVF